MALLSLPGVDRDAVIAHVEAELPGCPWFVRDAWPAILAAVGAGL